MIHPNAVILPNYQVKKKIEIKRRREKILPLRAIKKLLAHSHPLSKIMAVHLRQKETKTA